MKPRWKAMYSGFLVTGDVDGHLHEKMTLCARDFGKCLILNRAMISMTFKFKLKNHRAVFKTL